MQYIEKRPDGTVVLHTLELDMGFVLKSHTTKELGNVDPVELATDEFVQRRNVELSKYQRELVMARHTAFARRRGMKIEMVDGKAVMSAENRELADRAATILMAFDTPPGSATKAVAEAMLREMEGNNVDCKSCARNDYVRKYYDRMEAALIADGRLK